MGRILTWTLVIILAAGVVVLGILFTRTRADLAAANQRITDITTVPDNIASLQSVVFVRADSSTLTYRVPRTDTVNGQSFVNYDERTATYSPAAVQFLGRLSTSGVDSLRSLPEGTNISILVASGSAGITEIYIPATQ